MRVMLWAAIAAVTASAAPIVSVAQSPIGPSNTLPKRDHSWILTCDVTPPGGAPEHRVFRIGPRLLQEFSARDKKFGGNLCESFKCRSNAARLEGQVSSPTVILTISLDRKTRSASWKTQGATGMKRSSGPCTIALDRPGGSGYPN